MVKTVKGLKIAAMIPLGLIALIYLVFGIGESLGGEPGGWMHLVELVILGLVMWLCWKFPLWGGVLLLVFSLVGGMQLLLVAPHSLSPATSPVVLIRYLPMALSGILLLAAWWVKRKQPASAGA
jgi:hypothetical protein